MSAAVLPAVAEVDSAVDVTMVNSEEECFAAESAYVDAIRKLIRDHPISPWCIPPERQRKLLTVLLNSVSVIQTFTFGLIVDLHG